jgi:hypothetical protein
VAIPTIVAVGLPIFTAVCAAITIFWCVMGVCYFGKRSAKLE